MKKLKKKNSKLTLKTKINPGETSAESNLGGEEAPPLPTRLRELLNLGNPEEFLLSNFLTKRLRVASPPHATPFSGCSSLPTPLKKPPV